ncbi:protein-export chaperone SecB [Desulforegula conservatrix]|uniref:protein-export chaperone SecB n=1 Tax=Desulforegula conservatrix TaxID=153026 RepID=UPI0003F76D22|nr:protein-export chaperone SecB [Desulforegula conservatrix]
MSAMAIKKILLPLIVFEINEGFDHSGKSSGDLAFNFDLKVGSNYLEKEKLLAVSVLAETPGAESHIPFRFKVKAVGNFSFDSDPDPALLETLKEVNCPAIIFPYIRECLADLSRRAGLSPINLPLVNFIKHRENARV